MFAFLFAAICEASVSVTGGRLGASFFGLRPVEAATASPDSAVYGEWVMKRMTGFEVISTHNSVLTIKDRNEAMTLTTHAADLFVGPKAENVLLPQSPPKPGKKGRILRWRAVAVVLDDPVQAVLSLAGSAYQGSGMPLKEVKKAVSPFLDHYCKFWDFWVQKAKGSAIAVKIFNLQHTNESVRALEYTKLHQFVVYNRCGPSEQSKCHRRGGNIGVCCALTNFGPDIPSTVVSQPVADWLRQATERYHTAALTQWLTDAQYFNWPSVSECCKG